VSVEIVPLEWIPELRDGDDLAGHLARAATRGADGLRDADVVVVAQKAVSKIEGRVVSLEDVSASDRARELAGDGDPRHLEVILRESHRVVRARKSFVVAETRHGFICASAGVDASNTPAEGTLVLLPDDPDASAARIRERLRELTGATVGVIVSDSFGRPWRQGTIDVAIGVAGIPALLDLRGTRDASGRELRTTQIAVADELASAAELVMGKDRAVPGAVIRGLHLEGEGTAADIPIPEERDLFR
jgi:coenzyme F420-0:L-glutamate ligase / coenzyme F420-1:gamma-L-glutamate ligase